MDTNELEKIRNCHIRFEVNSIKNGPYTFKGIRGNENYNIYSWEKPTLKKFPYLAQDNFILFKDIFGLRTFNQIQIIASFSDDVLTFLGNNKFVINIEYQNESYYADFTLNGSNFISDLYERQEILQIELKEKYWVIEIKKEDNSIILLDEKDILDIFESLFFELEVNFTQGYFKIEKFPLSLSEMNLVVKPIAKIPEKFNFIYKKYNQDLLDYYRIANELHLLPFKFLSFYHILEYFSEKSLINELKNKLKKIYHQNDFNDNMDKYLIENIRLVKKGARPDGINDLKKVINLYGNVEGLMKKIETSGLKDYFSNDLIIDENKNYKFPKLIFNKQGFTRSIAHRIYAIRNSIVHSNSESLNPNNFLLKATEENGDKILNDTELMNELVINVIKSNQKDGLQQSAVVDGR